MPAEQVRRLKRDAERIDGKEREAIRRMGRSASNAQCENQRVWRVLTSPWNTLLLVFAALLIAWHIPHLPNNPRDGYSTVGVWLHGTHAGAPPGTPYVWDSPWMIIATRDGDFRAEVWRGTYSDGDGWERMGAAQVHVTRLREGFLTPTRETRGCTVLWGPAKDMSDDGKPIWVPTEDQDLAMVAMIDAFRANGTMAGEQEAAVALEHYRAGRNPQPPRTLSDGVRTIWIFLCAIMAMLVALPGSVHALLIVKRRVFPRYARPIDQTPRCARCSYDLTAMDSDRCPECGEMI